MEGGRRERGRPWAGEREGREGGRRRQTEAVCQYRTSRRVVAEAVRQYRASLGVVAEHRVGR
eukprot:2660407-Rhodomonas_salina.2